MKRFFQMRPVKLVGFLASVLSLACTTIIPASACTGISLRASDGSRIVARTVEWALSDADHDTLVLFPRDHQFTAQTPEGFNGLSWTGRYGFISLGAYGEPYGPDGMNEAGLYVGMYYFPEYASFAPYEASQAARSLSVGDLMRWMLSSFATVDEVRVNIEAVRVVNVEDPRFGGAPLPFHWKIEDPSGASIVIEIVNGGKVQIHESFMGVITNSPDYGWHLTNLRNYLGLSPVAELPVEIAGETFAPFGAGTGLRGLPGDFTPPSRFVRAVALSASGRPLETGNEAVFEAFRILDSFNIPVGATGPTDTIAADIESATQITTAWDLTARRMFFHTMSDREVRTIDLNRIDFDTPGMRIITEGASARQTVRDITP
ncbi:choloylglycine hydrolase family protein [Hyphomonadaceae bacterium BL14]|nr:choloylglycine hydrolase family protein [Hyphomonadaceae bacterium BL14]